MRSEPRAVLWDMDGTLLDSAEYHWLTWREVLAEEKFELTRERFAESFGRRNDDTLREYFGQDFPPSEIERISDIKEARYREMVRARGVEPLPGVRRWLGRLKAEGWRQAVASSAMLLNVEAILDALNIKEYFNAIVSAEDVRHGKPDPEIFLVAAERLEARPARCIVIEDSPAGIEAARRAGMRTIGVLSSHDALEADRVVRTLDEFPDDGFDQLQC
jgi:beta-phosphoglucomutase family hydrolase